MAKILLSSIGTRGDVQPILALAVELKASGHDPILCVAPDFKTWVESFDIAFVPVGPPLKGFTMRAPSGKRMKISQAQKRQMVLGSVRNQFQVIGEAAKGVDLILAGGALQTAAHSVAEVLKIPYIYSAYCACTLPSSDYPPWRLRSQSWPRFVNTLAWKYDDRMWNSLFRDPVNEQRAALGLAPIANMTSHVFTDRPWLAADAALSPMGRNKKLNIFQTGAWFLPDTAPLPDALEQFLAHGEPPIYFGFGSMVSPGLKADMLIQVARKLRRRALISQGWANLKASNSEDCLAIGDMNHEKLFPRVAAIVHHGGAGTTTAAARAGKPQVIVPQNYDQFFWAHRVRSLDIGRSVRAYPNVDEERLITALNACLTEQTALRARTIATQVELHGAAIAAQRLLKDFS